MSNFSINSEINKIFINKTTFKKSSQNKPVFPTINAFNNRTTNNISRLYKKRSINRNRDIPRFNDRRNVRKPLDTTAIRENRYNFSTGRYDSGYPRPSNYPLCPQKISTVFQYGDTHFTTSTTTISYPLEHDFIKVSEIVRPSSVDFSGNYVLDWSLSGGGKLLSSDNSQVNLGTFTFYQLKNYFDIYLYAKPNINNISYVHIRYRVPIRYRYAYEDWTFWESLLIENTLSETEFVKIVNCCF
jgi:hypothetical protein